MCPCREAACGTQRVYTLKLLLRVGMRLFHLQRVIVALQASDREQTDPELIRHLIQVNCSNQLQFAYSWKSV